MPTIPQLPVVTTVNAFDELPISQNGIASSVTVGLLLADTQPAVLAASGTLLGRVSLGPGGPESVAVGTGLALSGAVVAATGADHAGFPAQQALLPTDQAVLVSAGSPRLLQLSMLRGLFSAGANVTIDQNGVITAGSGISGSGGSGISSASINAAGHLILTLSDLSTLDVGAVVGSAGSNGIGITSAAVTASGHLLLTLSNGTTSDVGAVVGAAGPAGPAGPTGPAGPAGGGAAITSLPTVSTIAAGDLVAISQAGTDHTITYANFVGGETIDQVQPAAAASDTDVFWVGQGSNVLVRQTLGAIWSWIATHLPGYHLPVVEIESNTTLDGSVHNGCLLICSQPVTLTPSFANMGSGFSCDIVNLSGANVTFASGITTSNGTGQLPTGQAATLYAATYSGGSLVFASIPGVATSITAPGAVTGLATSAVTQTSMQLSWTAPSSGGTPSSYTVQYRVNGTSSWSIASSAITGTSFALTGLTSSTSYDTQVFAVNAAGTGTASAIVTTKTGSAAVPSQVTGLAAGTPTTNAVPLTWTAPTAGGTVSAYTVQYRVTGTSTWTTASTTVTTTSYTVAGLALATGYDFQVLATNSGGAGTPSATVSATTLGNSFSVTLTPGFLYPQAGTNTHGTGTIAINVNASPNPASAQIGLSTSATVPPTSFTAAGVFNTNVWGSYVPTPATAGSYYIWAQAFNASNTLIGQLISPTAVVTVV